MGTIADYYRDPNVRQRIMRFVGGETTDDATAVYITACDPARVQYDPKPVAGLHGCLDAGLDVGRSLWDRDVLIAHFDIDYANFTFPAEAHLHPERTFSLLQPVIDAAWTILAEHDVHPLHLLSGGGHHLVWSIRQDSPTFDRLAELGRLPRSLQGAYRRPGIDGAGEVPQRLGRAHAGLGMVLEHMAHLVLERAAGASRIPVEVTAVRVGPGARGAEMTSLDISEYADPLHLRTIRIPFSVYLKASHRQSVLGEHVVRRLPPMFLIPLEGLDVGEGLSIMRSPRRVQELAARPGGGIPECSDAYRSMIETYARSPLAEFHDWFYSREHQPPERWPATYDALSLHRFPPCGRKVLAHPCDMLMQPGRIRHVVRLLLADGWHPRHIAGLIRSKYERNYGWGHYWYHYDATSRADFYTRIFAGLFFAGRDDLVDFNCRSTQEKYYCSRGECTGSVDSFRGVLLDRRRVHV